MNCISLSDYKFTLSYAFLLADMHTGKQFVHISKLVKNQTSASVFYVSALRLKLNMEYQQTVFGKKILTLSKYLDKVRIFFPKTV
jgi:hypothetical protein